jgi:alpha-N-arabinofuranosidase
MDKYDPNKAIALIVDEWGIWTDVEPGTNPGFLYQQNTLRDALLAALNFDIFNKHADRVKMANIAQTVNVLQSVVLTDKEKMLLTPTYHAFKFYTVHHDAALLPVYFQSPDYTFDTDGKTEKIPALSSTASKNADGVNLTLTNIDPNKAQEIEIELRGGEALKSVSAEILTAGKFTAHNTFDSPDNVTGKSYDGCTVKDGKLIVKLEPMSLVLVKINR